MYIEWEPSPGEISEHSRIDTGRFHHLGIGGLGQSGYGISDAHYRHTCPQRPYGFTMIYWDSGCGLWTSVLRRDLDALVLSNHGW
ncbi:MAG: hypothetical protein KDB26_12760 [Microthrixaceae bacterium]|nr:hypothetical protein [Microthrixaceae bacterium]